jgi:sodium/potassium-transporting ATPase subunit alpha
MVAVVNMQWAELLIVKTRTLSILHQGFKNPVSIYAFIFENLLCAFLCYVPYLNTALGLRMLATPHYMVISLPFLCIMFFYDECRKYLIRRGINKETLRYENWFSQNAYY